LTKPLPEKYFAAMKCKITEDSGRRRNSHLPGSVRKNKKQGRTNDKNQ